MKIYRGANKKYQIIIIIFNLIFSHKEIVVEIYFILLFANKITHWRMSFTTLLFTLGG